MEAVLAGRGQKDSLMTKRIEPIDMRVGQRVRAYRLSRGMTQMALGERVGVTFQQIQKYERGINRMGSSRLKKVATILGISVAALFGEDQNHSDETIDGLLSETHCQQYTTRLLRAFDAIKDSRQRLALVQFVESMGQGMGQGMDQAIGQDTEHGMAPDIGQEIDQEIDQDIDEDIRQVIGEAVDQSSK
jgi:transcriptional regulator with XRE-family HTH domain